MRKGFTLLELLIVIGILAILAATVTLILNPAELLKQARDSQRVSDLASLNSALGLYTADVASINLGVNTNCYTHNTGVTNAGCQGAVVVRHGLKTAVSSASRSVSGAGWIPVNFSAISSGSPLPNLPVDPSNSTTYFYSYALNTASSTYELNANFESNKYRESLDLDAKDGGNQADIYEIGSQPGFDI